MMANRFTFLLFVVILIFSSCAEEERSRPAPDLESIRQQEPRSELFDFVYLFSELGQKKAMLKAPYAKDIFVADQNETEFHLTKGMELFFYDSTGKEISHLKANQGVLYQNKGFAEAIGNVVWQNEKNEKLESERLRWFRKSDQVSTPEFVKITTPTDVLYGDSLVANLGFSRYKIYKIKGHFTLKETL